MSVNPSASQASLALVAALTRSHSALSRELDREITAHRLTQPQFAVLEILSRRGPLPLHELGKEMLVSGGNITCVVDNLEKAGLVVRTRDTQDRRVIRADLTPAGGERLAAIMPDYQARVGALAAGLTDVEQGILVQLLRKLADTVLP
ncbi:MAG: MarR family winged helix-turn-helix transcriptional regulator [Candidatus Sericytochromatia bacterium]